jgi:hypothetical protein
LVRPIFTGARTTPDGVHNEPEAALLSGGDVLDSRAHAARVSLPRAIRAGIFFASGPLALELRLEAAALETRVKDTDTADPDANLRNHDLRYFSSCYIIYCKIFTN